MGRIGITDEREGPGVKSICGRISLKAEKRAVLPTDLWKRGQGEHRNVKS